MIENNISDLNQKIENDGITSQGKLGADEFNRLVNAVIESQEKIEEYFTPISESEYESLKESGRLTDRPYFIYED